MHSNFRKATKDQFQDLGVALVILIKEAIFAIAVFLVGHLIGWLIHLFSESGDQVANLVKSISDVGAVLLFVVLVGKDLWEYSRK